MCEAIAPSVLRHRIILNFDAHADGETAETILQHIMATLDQRATDGLQGKSSESTHMDEPLLDSSFSERLERLTLHWNRSFRRACGRPQSVPLFWTRTRISGPSTSSIKATICAPSTGALICAWRNSS